VETAGFIIAPRGCCPVRALAGAYGFGRTRSVQLPNGKIKRTKKKVAPEEWYAFIPNAHAGFISWEEYQEIKKCSRRTQRNTGASDSELLREKVLPCYRGWQSAGNADDECMWHITNGAVIYIRITSVGMPLPDMEKSNASASPAVILIWLLGSCC